MNFVTSPTVFVYNDTLYLHSERASSSRYYMLVESAGKKHLSAFKRIPRSLFEESLEACKQIIGGAS